MKRKNVFNVLLVVITATLFLIGYYLNNRDISQILSIAGVVMGFWAVMRIFKIKPFATKD